MKLVEFLSPRVAGRLSPTAVSMGTLEGGHDRPVCPPESDLVTGTAHLSPSGCSPDICLAFLSSPSKLRDGLSHPSRFLAPDVPLEGLRVGSPGRGCGERTPRKAVLAAPSAVCELGCQSRCPGLCQGGKELSGPALRQGPEPPFLPRELQARPDAKFRRRLRFPVSSCPAPQRRRTKERRSLVPVAGRGSGHFAWSPVRGRRRLVVEIQAGER